jgi:hypothetical protein
MKVIKDRAEEVCDLLSPSHKVNRMKLFEHHKGKVIK